jgi:hypothetical protein
MRFRPWGLGISGRDVWDPAERRWKGPSLLGENDGPTRLGDILPSGIGPDEILEWSGQPEGTYLDLKDRIVATQQYDVDGPANLMVTAGANHANFVTMLTLIEPGDEVIAARPSWPQFYILAEGFGARVKMMDLEEEANWHWDADKLNEMVTRKTKLICICNPNNPTGSRLTEKEVRAISENNVRVNCISPGAMAGADPDGTQTVGMLSTPEENEQDLKSIPLGRIGTPRDVANVAVFLASNRASYVHGTTIDVNGGRLIRH